MKQLRWCVIIALVATGAPMGARTVSLAELAQVLARKNSEVVTNRSELERAQVEYKSVRRLNTPVLTADTIYTGTHNEDMSVPAKTDQRLQQVDLGVSGRLYRWGLGYSLAFVHNSQTQKAFDTFPQVKKDGQDLTLGLEFDLLKDAGFRVGELPAQIATGRVRLVYNQGKALNQSLTRDLVNRYLTVLLTQQQIATAKVVLSDSEGLRKHYENLFQEGSLSKVEFLSADVQVASLRSNLLRLTSLLKEQLRDLFSFVGGADDSNLADVDLKALPDDFISPAKVEALRAATDRKANAELLALEAEKKVLDAEGEELKNKMLPSLKLVGGESWNKNEPGESFLAESDFRKNQWFVGIRLSVPLSDIGPRADMVSKRIQANNIGTKQQLLNQNLDLRLRGLFDELISLDEQLKVTVELERLNSERYKATLPLLERSTSARLDIFDFQNQLHVQRSRLSELQSEILRKRAEILYLNGAPIL